MEFSGKVANGDEAGAQSQVDSGPKACSTDEVSKNMHKIKLEKENKILRKSLYYLNERLGDQYINDSESSLDEEFQEFDNPVNTRHMQIDAQFAPRHFYKTDVSLSIEYSDDVYFNFILNYKLELSIG